MRRLIATAMAGLGGTLLLTSAVLFGSGLTGMNAMLQPEPESEFVASGPDGPPSALPTPTPTVVDPSAGSHDVNPFDAPPGTSAEDIANGKIVLAQRIIESECMKEKGFDYPVEPPYFVGGPAPSEGMWPPTIPEDRWDAAFVAMFGDTGGGADYHWEDAGCKGLAVHETGQDDVH